MSRTLVWDGDISDDDDEGVAPSTTQDIRNSYDGRGKRELAFSFVNFGTPSLLTVDIWVWNGTQYAKTGQQYIFEEGVENVLYIDAGQWIAVTVDDTDAEQYWVLEVGYVV